MKVKCQISKYLRNLVRRHKIIHKSSIDKKIDDIATSSRNKGEQNTNMNTISTKKS